MKRLANISVLAGVTLSLLAGVNYLSHYPIKCEADDAQTYGEPLLRNSGADVALIVDTAEIRLTGNSGKFSETNWSYGWMNLLLQEEKRFDIIDISESKHIPTNKSVVVITARTASPSNYDAATTLYELPDSELLEILSQGAITISSSEQVIAADNYGLAFPAYPLHIDTNRATSLWELNGAVLLAELRSDGVRVLISAFDFGKLAVTIQQGLPNDDFSVSSRITKKTGSLPLVSGDLVSDSAYYQRFEPFFDRFEHDYWRLITGGTDPKPLFAESSKGAFIMSHDEEGMGDNAAWQPEQEKRWGVKSSVLVSPAAITSEGIQRMRNAGAEVLLHPDQYSYFERPGLPGLRPFRKEISIADQKQRIESLGNENSSTISISRNHWLLWENHYTAPLRKLAGAGIKFDLSYGPLGDGLIGYIFGTAFPFVPLDTNGFPLPILELPFLLQDDELFEASYLDHFFDTSQFNEEIINVIFHSNTMGHSPDTLILWAWHESFLRAESNNLPIKQYGELLEAFRTLDATLPASILER